jgi:hypothetical protein
MSNILNIDNAQITANAAQAITIINPGAETTDMFGNIYGWGYVGWIASTVNFHSGAYSFALGSSHQNSYMQQTIELVG